MTPDEAKAWKTAREITGDFFVGDPGCQCPGCLGCGDCDARLDLDKAIAAALLEAAGQWNADMDAAPRDGTPVLLVVTGGPNGPAFGEAVWHDDDGGDWWWAGNSPGDYHGGPISEIQLGQPTHWRHLPAPPETDAKA